MPKAPRIAKSLSRKLQDLDEHLYLLRKNLHELRGEPAHLKVIAAELRTLVCMSSGTDGLLWRLARELTVSDGVELHLAGSVDPNHPLAQDLHFAVVPIARAGDGDPRLPVECYSLEKVIKEAEAVFIEGHSLTHERLIKAIAEQMGTAHEDEGLEPSLVALGGIFVNEQESYIPVLGIDADLTLQIGERVLDHAARQSLYERPARDDQPGTISVAIRLKRLQPPFGRIQIFTIASDISEAEITAVATAESMIFFASRISGTGCELGINYPPDWREGNYAVFAFSYSSAERCAWISTGHQSQTERVPCDLGWLEACDFGAPRTYNLAPIFEGHSILVFHLLLDSNACEELREGRLFLPNPDPQST